MTELDFEELDKAVSNLMKEATGSDDVSVKLDTSTESGSLTPPAPADTTKSAPKPEVASSDSRIDTNARPIAPAETPKADSNTEAGGGSEAPVADSPERPSSSPSLATKRRGRFMDVIHPSLDMNAATPAPKRVGVTVRPMAPDIRPIAPAQVPETSKEDAPEAVEPIVENEKASANEEQTPIQDDIAHAATEHDEPETDTSHLDAPHNDYPDPLTLMMEREVTGEEATYLPDAATPPRDTAIIVPEREGVAEVVPPQPNTELATITLSEAPSETQPELVRESEQTQPDTVEDVHVEPESEVGRADPSDATAVEATPVVSEPIETGAAQEEAPLTSPFLPNAKVEKRPLGGSAADDGASGEAPSMATLVQNVNEDEAIIASQKAAIDVPMPAELSGEVATVESASVVEMVSNVEPKEANPSGVTPESSPAGGGSIPQQYQEQPSDEAPASGGIYDTETYHHPLEHPAKKKSGIGVIIWILVLLIVGAVAGVAFFYLKMR